MNGFLQSNFPFRGPIILRSGNEHAAQASDLRLHLLAPRAHSLNTRTGSLWERVSSLPKNPQVEDSRPHRSWYTSCSGPARDAGTLTEVNLATLGEIAALLQVRPGDLLAES